jgi:hypothetical protein
MMQYWQSERDHKMFQFLETPEKKDFAREQFRLKLAKAKLEHCKLMAGDDDVPEEVITSTASNTSSAT